MKAHPRIDRAPGFTLVELLVVIAIIALLVSILLPAIGKSRVAARLTLSLSNSRQIGLAMQTYRNDFKDALPSIFTTTGGQTATSVWAYGGKYVSQRQATAQPLIDIPPGKRPLNSYVYPTNVLDQTVVATNRPTFELTAFRSPGDRGSAYPPGQRQSGQLDWSITGYNDIGTSYPQNNFWWQLARRNNTLAEWNAAWSWGLKQFNSGFVNPTKFVMFSDQTAVALITDDDQPPPNRLGEFGDINKSVLTFLDGRADYIKIERRAATTLNPSNPFGVGSVQSGRVAADAPFEYSFILGPRR